MLLMVELLIGFRAKIVQRRVKPTPIVERLNVVEDVRSRLVAGAIRTMVYPLALQRAEEALHRGIVVPSADAIHADLDVPVL